MRATYVDVLGYVALVIGAAVTLWRAGVLNRVPWINTTLAIVGAIALAAMLVALTSPRGQ
jgi:hypothetical protein